LVNNGRTGRDGEIGSVLVPWQMGHMRVVERTQILEHCGVIADAFCVLPLGIIATYIARPCEEGDSEEQVALRNALYGAVRESYPLDTALPIGSSYRASPFLTITSQDLRAMRAKLFRSGHTLLSRELNILSMILAP
jgi:hypothetical protein